MYLYKCCQGAQNCHNNKSCDTLTHLHVLIFFLNHIIDKIYIVKTQRPILNFKQISPNLIKLKKNFFLNNTGELKILRFSIFFKVSTQNKIMQPIKEYC